MRSSSVFKIFTVVFLTGMLSACGFHLRGSYSVPQELSQLSFSSNDEYSVLTRYVKAQLQLNKISIVPPAKDIPHLRLIKETVSSRTLSLYQNSRVAEKELTYVVHYSVTLPNLGVQNFTTKVNRNYMDNPLAALAKSVERDVIVDEMRTRAARQMMRQLSRIRATYESKAAQQEEKQQQNLNIKTKIVQ